MQYDRHRIGEYSNAQWNVTLFIGNRNCMHLSLKPRRKLGPATQARPVPDFPDYDYRFPHFAKAIADLLRDAPDDKLGPFVLGSELFQMEPGIDDIVDHFKPPEGIPWVMNFASQVAKSNFLNIIKSLSIVYAMVEEAERAHLDSDGRYPEGGLLFSEKTYANRAFMGTFARIAHRDTLLERLKPPTRATFERNDHWYMCLATSGGFRLAAAEGGEGRKLDDEDSLLDLIGSEVAGPDDESAAGNVIQLRIVEPITVF